MSDEETTEIVSEPDLEVEDEAGRTPSFYNPNGDKLVEKSKQKSIDEILTPKRVYPADKPWLKKLTPAKEIPLVDPAEEPKVNDNHSNDSNIQDPYLKEDTNVVEGGSGSGSSFNQAPTVPEDPVVDPTNEHAPVEEKEHINDNSDPAEETNDVTEEYHEDNVREVSDSHSESDGKDSEPIETSHDEDANGFHVADTPHEISHEEHKKVEEQPTDVDLSEDTHDVTEEVHEDVHERSDPTEQEGRAIEENHDPSAESIDISHAELHSLHSEENSNDSHHDTDAQLQAEGLDEEKLHEEEQKGHENENEHHYVVSEDQHEEHDTVVEKHAREEENDSDRVEHGEEDTKVVKNNTNEEKNTEHEERIDKKEEYFNSEPDDKPDQINDIEHEDEEKHDEAHTETQAEEEEMPPIELDLPSSASAKRPSTATSAKTAAKPAASKLTKPKVSAIPKPTATATKTTVTKITADTKPKSTVTAVKPKTSLVSPRSVTATTAVKKTEKPATKTATAASAKKVSTTAAKTSTAVKTEAKVKPEAVKPKTAVKPKEAAKPTVTAKAEKPKTTTATAVKAEKPKATAAAVKVDKPKTPRTAVSATPAAAKTTAEKPKAAAAKTTATKVEPKAEKPKTPRTATATISAAKTSEKTVAKPAAVTATKPKLTPVTVPVASAAKAAPKPATVKTPRATTTATKEPAVKSNTNAPAAKTKPAATTTSSAKTAPKASAKKAEKSVASKTAAKTETKTKPAPAKGTKTTATKAAAKKTSIVTATKTKAAPAKGAKTAGSTKAAAKKSGSASNPTAKNSAAVATVAQGSVPKPGLVTARKPTGAQNRRKPTVNPIQGMKSLEQHTQQNKSNGPETPHKRMIQLRHVATPTSKEKLATFSLFKIQGRKVLIPEKVELNFKSLHVSCAFVLDTKDKIFVWYGPEANRMEKAFAVDFAKRLKDEDNMGRSQTFVIGECKEYDEDEFWNYLGGGGEIPSHDEKKDVKPVIHFYRINEKIEKVDSEKLLKEVLNDLFCFVMDCPTEVYCWMGKNTSEEVREKAMEHAKTLLNKKRLKWVKIEKLLSGVPEPVSFKVKFANWGGRLPIATGPAPMPAAKKRIPLTKYDVTKLYNRPAKPKEAVIDNGSGKTLMWIVRRSENNEKVPLAKKDYGHFFSGESYIILYTYTIKNTEHKMIYFWQGRNSTVMDKGFSAVLTIDLDDKLGGEAKQIRVVQGKEPQHFLKIFGGLIVVHKGKYNAEENYLTKTKLYQLKGTFESGILLEVDLRLRSVNINDSFLLSTPLKTYFMHSPYLEISVNVEKITWVKDTEIIEFASDSVNDDFIDMLGLTASGEKIFSETYPWLYQEEGEEEDQNQSWPILYQAQILTGQFKIEEIFDFTQDDLMDRDVFILDCKDTIWVWFGKNSVPILQQLTLETLLDYVDQYPSGERLGDPINIIKSGLEPLDFTVHFFGWEYPKSSNPQSFSVHVKPMEEVLELIKKKYTYDELIKNTPEYCDKSKLELYMTDEEFERVFGMNKEEFENLSDWKRVELKKQKQLF